MRFVEEYSKKCVVAAAVCIAQQNFFFDCCRRRCRHHIVCEVYIESTNLYCAHYSYMKWDRVEYIKDRKFLGEKKEMLILFTNGAKNLSQHSKNFQLSAIRKRKRKRFETKPLIRWIIIIMLMHWIKRIYFLLSLGNEKKV